MNRVKQLRLEKGVKQAELAEYLNVAQNTLSYWEAGKYDIDNKSLIKIGEYFNKSVDYILGISDDPTPPNKKEPTYEIGSFEWFKQGLIKRGFKLTDEQIKTVSFNVDAICEAFQKHNKE